MAISYKDAKLAKEIITDRYRNPRNKGLKGYGSTHLSKDSCIDDIEVELKVKDNIVIDANWEGVACAICTSSVDIVADLIEGKTLDEAKKILIEFNKMANGMKFKEDILGEALVFHNISVHTARIGCATLGPSGFFDKIKK